MPEIYQPAEDSFFLNEFVEREMQNLKDKNNIKVLDMGSGSGIQGQTCIDLDVSPQNLTLVDINPSSINFLKNKFPMSKIIQSNLFERLKERYDIIIFNPPYLPEDKFDKEKDTTGGKRGNEIINEFLRQAKKYLSKSGGILLLTSSFTKNINWQKYKKILLGKKKIFFEDIYVWKLMQ